MLTTEEGKTHRFRDSTTLQKWVVERRVGRTDRVCPPGGSWRRLGDVDELRPFFDVVDQADRAAAAARVARPTRPETPRTSSEARSAYVSHDADDDDILTSSRRSRPSAVSESFATLMPDDDLVAAGLGSRHGGRKLAFGVVVVLGIVAAYVGFKGTTGIRLPWSLPDKTTVAVQSPAPAPTPTATPTAPIAAAPPAPVAVPSLLPVPVQPPAPVAPAVAPIAAAPAAHPPAAPPDQPSAPASSEPRGGPPAAEAGRPKSYQQLVSDADHALENGQTGKAQKLYDEALRLQPSGVAAMTGAAYLLLDRQKPLAAIDMFQRALSNSPAFPQALFGLGEAHRLAGQPAKGIEAYKRYLEMSPTGSDAPAARRQMRELESQAAAAASRQEQPSAQPSAAQPSPPSPSPSPTSPPPQM